MNPLFAQDLKIHPQRLEPNVIRLDWLGRSDARYPGEFLQPYLTQVLDVAREQRSSVEMHFERLEFFNSSTVSVLINFVQLARLHRVPIRYSYEPAVRWQRLCFEALRVFESLDDCVRVTPTQKS